MDAYMFLYFSGINYKQNESMFLIFPKIINLRTQVIYAANILCLLKVLYFIYCTVSSILELELDYLTKMINEYQTPTVIKI